MSPSIDLTASVLARTSGSPCPRLREQVSDFIEGGLTGPDLQLVTGHLEHCASCRSLVATLIDARRLLPALASVDPGPWFAARVRRACEETPRSGWWLRLVERPRLAFEGAFLGVALCMMALAVFGDGPTPNDTMATLKPGVHLVADGLRGLAGALKQPSSSATEPSDPPLRFRD